MTDKVNENMREEIDKLNRKLDLLIDSVDKLQKSVDRDRSDVSSLIMLIYKRLIGKI